MAPRFRKPPINEVIIGAWFDPPLTALGSEHIGLLWSRLREKFPTVEQRPPIGGMAQRHENALTIDIMATPPMPRYWFVSEDEATLIQVQQNAFFLNWRRRESEYPQYSGLKPNFDHYYRILEEFLENDVGVKHPGISHCELAYIDMIEPSEYWRSPQDTPDIIRSFSIPGCASVHDAPVFNCAYRYNVESNLQLHVAIRSGEPVGQSGSPLLYLEFRALGSPVSPAKSETDIWYDRAHEVIFTQFLDMTTERAQRELWALEETA